MNDEVLEGSYTFEQGQFIPDEGMQSISERISKMKLLADIGDGTPSFYLNEADQSFWEVTEFENYRTQLRKVDRAYIREKFPTVDPDRPL